MPGCGECAAVFADLLWGLGIDVGETVSDELDGEAEKCLEVIGGEEELVVPIEAEPADVGFDGFDVFGFLFGGVGVVESEVAGAVADLVGDAEVEADRFWRGRCGGSRWVRVGIA